MQQQIEETDKVASTTIRDWEDLGYMSDDEGLDARGIPDAAGIDSTSERRRQLDGFKAELDFSWREAERAAALVGRGELSEFSHEIPSFSQGPSRPDQSPSIPEFTPNEQRDKPHAAQVQMNHILGLEGSDLIFGAIEAY
ncbi:hypothetical protein F5B21DRAFT_457379 [Xylaria acuta]|nr:hypothetical protein F5B21DRAFT_457379 [Xylaria acuta]